MNAPSENQRTPTVQERIQQLEEQLAELHDRNITLEFRLRQAHAENEDHEKDYLAVWKALRPRHGAGFQQDHENIAQAVQRLVNEVPALRAVADHAQAEQQFLREQLEAQINRPTYLQGIIGAAAELACLKAPEGCVMQLIAHAGGSLVAGKYAQDKDFERLQNAGYLKNISLQDRAALWVEKCREIEKQIRACRRDGEASEA